jgi:hypothetical protein
MIGALYDALTGEYGLVWQLISLVITVPVLLIGLLAFLALLDQMFGWRLIGSRPDRNPAATPEEAPVHDDDGPAENGHVTHLANGAEQDDQRIRVRRVPHPDDPPPAEAGQPPEEEDRATPAPPPQPEPGSDVYYHIRRLAELRDDGVIDSKEFEAKKSELLDRI